MNDDSIYLDKLKERIALAESRIQAEIDALLVDITPTDCELELKLLRDVQNTNYKEILKSAEGGSTNIGRIMKSHVKIKLII